MTFADSVRTWAVEHLRSLDAEFRPTEIVLVHYRELPESFRPPSHIAGYTSASLDLIVKPKWIAKSRAFACCLREPMPATVGDYLATVVHEAAHYLVTSHEEWRSEYRRMERNHVARIKGVFNSQQLNKLDFGPCHNTTLPWQDHGPEWIRAVCHLVGRARLQKIPVDADMVFNHHAYGLSTFHEYLGAFMDEVLAKRATSRENEIRRILQTPLPRKAKEVWDRDIRRCRERNLRARESSQHVSRIAGGRDGAPISRRHDSFATELAVAGVAASGRRFSFEM